MYYTYMLRCIDNSIYTGITNNLDRRMNEHFNKDKRCAKYTMNRTVVKLEAVWECNNRMLASKLEFHIKELSKEKKELLILNNDLNLINKIDSNEYRRYKYVNVESMARMP